MSSKKLKIGDRVKRTQLSGCLGTVKDVRSEVTAVTQEAKERGLLIQVHWDNGTMSYFGPDGLEVVKE